MSAPSVECRPRVRAVFEDATAYRRSPFSGPIDLWLDGNEGPPLPSALLRDVLASIEPELRRYPDATALTGLLAARHGVDRDRVLVTAGADEAIDRSCRLALGENDEAVVPWPCFAMIPKAVAIAGGTLVRVPFSGAPVTAADVVAAVTERTRLVFLTSPDNPTGFVSSAATLRDVALSLPNTLIVVDLVYVEFSENDPTNDLVDLPNVVVLRSLSKAFGLAGLRVGYAVSSPDLIRKLRAAGPPYSVSSVALRVAERMVSAPPRELAVGIARVREERGQLRRLLADLGAVSLPSFGNFVLARSPQRDWLLDALASQGIAVRGFGDDPELRDACRITCPGDERAFDRLTFALTTALRPEAVLFDMDGVLADVSASYREAILATVRSFGGTLQSDQIAAAKRDGAANDDWDLTRRLLLAQGIDVALDIVTERFERFYQGDESQPGFRERETLLIARDTLIAWSRRYPLAVVTGRPREDAERFLRRFGLEQVFATVIAREDAALKPDPAPVRVALERLGVARAWMVGDTVDDIRAARAAEVVPLGIVAPGGSEPDRLALKTVGAARVLESLTDLEELLP